MGSEKYDFILVFQKTDASGHGFLLTSNDVDKDNPHRSSILNCIVDDISQNEYALVNIEFDVPKYGNHEGVCK